MVLGKSWHILAVGELNPDLILSEINAFPELGKERLAGRFAQRLGSSTAIAASQMARLGLRTALISRIGKDSFGAFCRQELDKHGVHTGFLIEDEAAQTGLTVSLSYPQDRMLITYPGTIGALRSQDVSDQLLRQASHLHVSSYFLQDNLRPGLSELFWRAKRWGLSISLDTGDDPTNEWQIDTGILSEVDVFLPNEAELLGITGEEDAEAALASLGSQTPIVAVKLGAQGALLRHNNRIERFPAYPVKVRDTTGAGDSFNAGFIYGFLQGWPPARCMMMANACGALSTTGLGGVSGFASVDDVQQFLDLNSQI